MHPEPDQPTIVVEADEQRRVRDSKPIFRRGRGRGACLDAGRGGMNAKLASLALFLIAVLSSGRPAAVLGQQLDDEQEIGRQVFEELRTKGEIVAASPLYDQLKPIADTVARV